MKCKQSGHLYRPFIPSRQQTDTKKVAAGHLQTAGVLTERPLILDSSSLPSSICLCRVNDEGTSDSTSVESVRVGRPLELQICIQIQISLEIGRSVAVVLLALEES